MKIEDNKDEGKNVIDDLYSAHIPLLTYNG